MRPLCGARPRVSTEVIHVDLEARGLLHWEKINLSRGHNHIDWILWSELGTPPFFAAQLELAMRKEFVSEWTGN
jgi:hypothetical protein